MVDKVLRREFNRDLAAMLLRDIQYQRSNYYYFLGGVTPWSGVGGDFTTDVPPLDGPLSIDTHENNRYHRSEMVFTKKINPNDVSLVASRYDWEPNQMWEQWDHTKDLSDKKYFVLTDDNNVYKCLYNSEGEISTVKPNHRGLDPVTYSDGYTWKYMYNISPFRFNRFRSTEYIPVQTAMSENFYNNGAVDSVSIISEGQNYISVPQTTIILNESGTMTGTGATGEVVVGAGGSVVGIIITNGGTEYTAGARVVINDEQGFGAIAEAVINSSGVIVAANILEPGIGYTEGSPVSFETGFGKLFPVISRNTGTIVDVRILDPGIGYSSAPEIIVQSITTGEGLYGNETAVFEAVVADGQIKHINVVDPGVNYPVDTDTTISVDGDGEDAEYFPVVLDGKIVDVIVENPGRKYTEINLVVNSASNSGTGAILRGIINPSDYMTDQSVIEQLPTDGIFGSKVIFPGVNYSQGSTVEVIGNGEGCTAHPIVISGGISKIIIDTPGENYTWAQFIIHDPQRDIESIQDEDKFIGYPILPPEGGHGKNASSELGATTVGIVTPLRSELEIQSIIQDYRKFGILKNPIDRLTKNRFIKETSIVVYRVRIFDASNMVVDEILTINMNKFKVFNINDNIVDLIALDKEYVPVGILRASDGREYTSIELLSLPDFDKFSGSLLYVSMEIPFTFSVEQSLTIKTYIRF